jgi:hypothetical protein
MVLSIIFLEDKHKIVLHLSISYEYQQFFQHRICFSIQPLDYSDPWPRLARSTSFFLIMLFNNSKITYPSSSSNIIESGLRKRWNRKDMKMRNKQKSEIFLKLIIMERWDGRWYLTPFSTIIQLYVEISFIGGGNSGITFIRYAQNQIHPQKRIKWICKCLHILRREDQAQASNQCLATTKLATIRRYVSRPKK